MKEEIIRCDRCGAKTELKTMCIVVDREMDPAGSMANECERVDVCGLCLWQYVTRKIRLEKSYDEARAFLAWMREIKERGR